MMKKFLKSLSLVMALVMCFTMVFTAAVSADGATPAITFGVADSVEPGTVSITVDATNFADVAGVQGEITVGGLTDAAVVAGTIDNVTIDAGVIAFAEEGEANDEGTKLTMANGTLFTITGTAVEGTNITLAWTADETKACDTDEVLLALSYANKTVEVKNAHVHEYVDGICACGEYEYEVVWGDFSYDLVETKLNVPYSTTTDAKLYTLLKTYTATNSGRSVDLVLDIAGTKYPFINMGVGTTERVIPVTGFSIDDMALDIKVFVRVTYTVDGEYHEIYCKPYDLKINDMLAADETLDADLYAKYVALCDAIAADEAAEEVALGSSDTDVIYNIAFAGVSNEVKATYRAGATGTTTRDLLAQYPAPGGRQVALVLKIDKAEFVFHDMGIGASDRTVPVKGFSLKDLSADMSIFTRVYHYGVNDDFAAYTNSDNSVAFNVADAMANGTSAVSVALADYLAAAYPA